MKDGYSFHSSEEDLVREFNLMEATYKKIYTKLGLDFRVVEADSGAIGGSGSKEFHVIASSGEDTIVVCDSCDYAANIEAAKRKKIEYNFEIGVETKVETLNTTTIEDVSKLLNVPTEQTLKAVIKKAIFKEGSKIAIFFVRGSDELEETKAVNSIDALEIIDATNEEISEAGIVAGYCGIKNLPKNVLVVVDSELEGSNSIVCGANEENYHLVNVDITKIENIVFKDLVAVKEGDICNCCGGKLSYTKGIEAGHIFQLGTKYSKAMNANFLDENGKAKPFVMGCYGIGVSRLVAAVIEQNHDDKGCIWTKQTAPFMVDVIVSNSKNEDEAKAGEDIYQSLRKLEIETILDDRINARFGFKIGDFELLGFPYAIIIGKKLSEGIVELVDRKTLEKVEVKIDEVVSKISDLIK